MKKRLTAYLFLLTASVIWGVAGPVIKYTLQFVSPFQFLFWRFFLTAIVALPILIWYAKTYPIRRKWLPRVLVLGFLATTVNLSFVFLGFDRTSAIEGTLIGSLAPIFVVVGAVIFLRERVTRQEQLGITLAVAGTVFTALEPFLRKGLAGQQAVIGNLLLILANTSWMVFVILSKRWEQEGLKPFHITGISVFIGLITFLPISFLETKTLPSIAQVPTSAFLGITYMAIFSFLVAYTAYEIGLSRVEASEADIFTYLAPVWAAPFALLWLGEKITPTFLIGAAFIAAGVAIAEYKPGILKGLRTHHLAHHR